MTANSVDTGAGITVFTCSHIQKKYLEIATTYEVVVRRVDRVRDAGLLDDITGSERDLPGAYGCGPRRIARYCYIYCPKPNLEIDCPP